MITQTDKHDQVNNQLPLYQGSKDMQRQDAYKMPKAMSLNVIQLQEVNFATSK